MEISKMLIRGLQKLTLIDYPGKVASTLFISGCNFKCPYCHNPELVNESKTASKEKEVKIYSENEILQFLKERKGFIDGVCITGGEPLLNKNLPSLIKKIRKIGYVIKLDTNGSNPEMLKKLVKEKIVDYVAMDIKAPLEKYEKIVNATINPENIKKSIDILKKMKDYEFRTTISPDLNKEDIIKIAALIKGARAFYLQQFVPKNCLDKSYEKKEAMKKEDLLKIRDEIKNFFDVCEIRAV